MEEIYEELKGTIVTHDKYQGIVCGYSEAHFILAVESKDVKNFFRVLKNDFFVEEEYKDNKYRYVLEDERTIVKQKIWQQKNPQT